VASVSCCNNEIVLDAYPLILKEKTQVGLGAAVIGVSVLIGVGIFTAFVFI
jgi:hypothetical protein